MFLDGAHVIVGVVFVGPMFWIQCSGYNALHTYIVQIMQCSVE